MRIFIVPLVLMVTACGQDSSDRATGSAVDQLTGWWAESFDDSDACAPGNVRARYTLSPDGKRLLMQMDRKWQTALGERDSVEATVLASSPRSLTIQYDGESRTDASGKPVTWDLVVVAPGLYRWRESSWEKGRVNVVVGVRCAP
jgi:hypothetical protein